MRKVIMLVLALVIMTVNIVLADEIHEAVKNNEQAKVKTILEKDRHKVNLREKMGMTPLHYAACFGRVQIAAFLISQGADIDARDNTFGFTPLHMAINRETAVLLVNQGAQVNARDNYGGTPLFAAVTNGRKDVVSFLISRGADVNSTTSYCMTPLKKAMSLYNDGTTRKDLKNNLADIIIILKKSGARE